MAENYPNMGKKTDMQIQEVQRVTNKINPKRHRCIIINMSKVKDKKRILKTREKTCYVQGNTPETTDFSGATLQAREK